MTGRSALVTTPGPLVTRDRARQCTDIAGAFALIASGMMMPILLTTPALLMILPIGLLWLIGVVVPGATLTTRFFRYALGLPIAGGPRRMWGQAASFCGIFGATLLYLCAAFEGGLLALPALAMCVMGGVALVARDRDRHAL